MRLFSEQRHSLKRGSFDSAFRERNWICRHPGRFLHFHLSCLLTRRRKNKFKTKLKIMTKAKTETVTYALPILSISAILHGTPSRPRAFPGGGQSLLSMRLAYMLRRPRTQRKRLPSARLHAKLALAHHLLLLAFVSRAQHQKA